MRTLYFAAVVSFFFFSLAYSQRSEIGCLPYFHTWWGLSANLECRSEMCCTRLTEIQDAKITQKNRHLCIVEHLCRAISSQLRHVSTIGKKTVKQHYLLHMSSQHGELRPTNGWDWLASLRNPSKFQRVSSVGFVTAPTSLNIMMFGLLLGWYTIYTFFRAHCQVQNSLCIQVLRSPILAVLLQHGSRAVVISQTLRRGTRNGITELSQMAPPIWHSGHHVGHGPTFLV